MSMVSVIVTVALHIGKITAACEGSGMLERSCLRQFNAIVIDHVIR